MSAHLCMPSRIPGAAGPAGFQQRLSAGLARRGVETCYNLDETPCDAVLVIGGTRDFYGLWRARRRGIPVIQRLAGLNWIHRVMPTGWRHFLRAEGNNLVLRLIRNRFADHIVYQSEFVRSWWEGAFGEARVEAKVIHNGVPLNQYMPIGDADRPVDKDRLLVVEAGLRGGYEVGLETAFQLANRLISDHKRRIELVIAGAVDEAVKERWSASAEFPVIWKGLIPPDAIPSLDRSAHLLIAADLNPACPNAVIEGIACGLPVVAFETGSLPEIVTDEAGRLAAYGADPWQLERPDYASLADAAVEILDDQVRFREGARRRALKAFGADRMVANYVGVFMKVAPAFGMV